MKKTGLSLLLVTVSGLILAPFGCLNAATPTPTPTATPTPAAVADVMTQALVDRDSLPAAVGSLWRFEGPTHLQRGSRIDSARINEIAIDLTHPTTMYVTGATGGVWKTVDGGNTWAARSQGWPIQAATAVAIDPNDPNRVFVGTGDYKRLDWVEPFSVGIMRSLDAGLTWSSVGSNEMREFTVSRIVFDTNNTQNVLAATGRGSRLPGGQVFRSTDGGGTWASVSLPDANWDDLESSNYCDTFWASATQRHSLDAVAGAGETGLLYKSANGGGSWTKVNLITPDYELNSNVHHPDTIQIACRPGSSSVFVAVYENAKARVFVTQDAGATWKEMTPAVNSQIPDPCNSKNPVLVPSYPVSVCKYAWGHAAFGVTTNRVYVGGVVIFSSELVTRAGEEIASSYTEITNSQIPGDFQCVVPDPIDPDAVFISCDGGIYRYFVQCDKVDSSLNVTLGVTQVFRMDVHPRHGGLIAFGAQDLGNPVSFFGNGNDAAALGKAANWRRISGGDGRSAAFRQDLSSKVYLSNTDGLIQRYDGGPKENIVTLQPDGAPNGQAPLLFQNDTLYYADQDFHWLLNPETKNDALDSVIWSSVPFRRGPSPTPPAPIQSLAFCPTNAQGIYAGSELGELFYSTNGGTGWTEVTTLVQSALPSMPIWAISPSSANCGDVLVAIGYEGQQKIRKGDNVFSREDRLFRKTDVLATGDWKGVHGVAPSLPHAPLYAIARLRSAPASKWFVAGDVGVFRTDDGGDHWTNATAPLGLPNTLVRDLRLSGDGNTLYAGTFGRGVWSMDVNPPANHLGVRGTVTKGRGPVRGIMVKASGPGRIKKFLKNTLTTGPIVTTAPIVVSESAKISDATISLVAIDAESAVLLTPYNTQLPMKRVEPPGKPSIFFLTKPPELVGKPTAGSWRFRVTGNGSTPFSRLSPSIVTGVVDLSFQNGVSGVTGPDGEFTLEYLSKGMHEISAFQANPGDSNCESLFGAPHCQLSVNLQSNRTGLDFRQTN